ERRHVAHDLEADAVVVELGDFLLEGTQEQLHEESHFFLRPAPVLAREREEREVLDAVADARLHDLAHRLDTLAMPADAREEALLRPAAIAVHDDGDVARDLRGFGNRLRRAFEVRHTDMSSFSFSATSLSMSAIDLSVIFWTSSWARISSSSLTSPSLRSALRWAIASRRILRTATFAFSPSCFTILVISRRRSSVSAGIGTRMTSPEVAGFTPRSESRMAFSTAWTIFLSQ